MVETLTAQCCIVGCGPAGAMLGLMLARRGVDVLVLEKHGDFLRDFRGDDIIPSTIEILDELGLAEAFLSLEPKLISVVEAHTPEGVMTLADLRRVSTRFPYIAVLPQWDFLDFVTGRAASYPQFRLRMNAEVTDIIDEEGTVRGVRYRDDDGFGEVRALLTVGADGRTSAVRDCAHLPLVSTAPPIDALWFRLPRSADDSDEAAISIHLGLGSASARINRGEYWQIAYLIPKGAAEDVRAAGLAEFRHLVSRTMPDLAPGAQALQSWDQISLLCVQASRLRRWCRPGLLCIGDAAHAMSPIGGAGINLAIADAVVAANLLAGPLRSGEVPVRYLAAVQRHRAWQIRLTQFLQARLTKAYLYTARSEARGANAVGRRALLRLANLPGLCAIRSRVTALGFRRVHVDGGVITARR